MLRPDRGWINPVESTTARTNSRCLLLGRACAVDMISQDNINIVTTVIMDFCGMYNRERASEPLYESMTRIISYIQGSEIISMHRYRWLLLAPVVSSYIENSGWHISSG